MHQKSSPGIPWDFFLLRKVSYSREAEVQTADDCYRDDPFPPEQAEDTNCPHGQIRETNLPDKRKRIGVVDLKYLLGSKPRLDYLSDSSDE